MPQIDFKLVAVAAIILGLFAGFYIDNTLLSKPRIDNLTQTVTEQTTSITNLETQLDELQDEHDTLQALYDQLNANNVPLSQYNQLQQQNEEQETQIGDLQTQVNSQLNSIETLQSLIDEKNDEILSLEDELDALQRKYESIKNPLYVAFSAGNLEINLTVTSDTYPENTEISGTATIRYIDGAPFHGTFKLSMYKVYVNSGTSSDPYTIDGTKIYSWSNPFILGAGSYKLSVSDIKDTEGVIVVPNTELRSNVIYLFIG